MEKRTQVWILPESHVRGDLQEFIRSEASLDDIARLASLCLKPGHIQVLGDNEVHSFWYCNGRRVKAGKESGG